MRFGDRIKFQFDIDEKIDLKELKVPALILQPIIENSIWHGLAPKEEGGVVNVSVQRNNGAIECVIDDNGIGRDMSKQYKSQYAATHQSKGIGLTQSRLELDKLLNQRIGFIKIYDKKNDTNEAQGTKVMLTFSDNIGV